MKLIIFCISIVLLASCTKQPLPVPTEIVKDIDGNIYHTVKIGTQTWMVENLKTTRYRNGEPIQTGLLAKSWQLATNGVYASYDFDESYKKVYGYLYNGWAAFDSRGIAPKGWHVPADYEWNILALTGEYSDAGYYLKEASTKYWWEPNAGAANKTGFTALPGGERDYAGQWRNLGQHATYWTSTLASAGDMWCYSLNYLTTEIERKERLMNDGYSVRCIKD